MNDNTLIVLGKDGKTRYRGVPSLSIMQAVYRLGKKRPRHKVPAIPLDLVFCVNDYGICYRIELVDAYEKWDEKYRSMVFEIHVDWSREQKTADYEIIGLTFYRDQWNCIIQFPADEMMKWTDMAIAMVENNKYEEIVVIDLKTQKRVFQYDAYHGLVAYISNWFGVKHAYSP